MYYLFVIGKTITSICSRKVGYVIAKFFALLQFYLSKADRRSVLKNLEPVISDPKERWHQAKNVFINFGYYLVDFVRHEKLDEDFIKEHVRTVGFEHLDQAMQKSKGAVLLTAHIGNYEIGGAILSIMGYPLHVVALPHKDSRLNRFFDHHREVAGVEVIAAGTPAIRRCYSALRNGEAVAFLGDRDFSGVTKEIPMFDRIANLPVGAAYFIARTKAMALPMFLIREGVMSYTFYCEPPIEYDPNDSNAQEVIINRYSKVLEEYIRRYPGQWYLFQEYWKKNQQNEGLIKKEELNERLGSHSSVQ